MADATQDGDVKSPEWMAVCRSFIDAVGDQIIVVSPDYQILLANRAFLKSTGLTEDQVVGQPCYEVTHRSSEPCWALSAACPLSAVMQRGEPCSVLHEHLDASQEVRYVDIIGSPVRDADGNVVALIESIRDVTPQRQLEEALWLRNADLEESRRKREEFTSAVCHELKNIVNVVGLHARLLKSTTDLSKAQDRAGIIATAAGRIDRLVEDMRDASAIETQRFTVSLESCDIRATVTDAAEARNLTAPAHRFVIDVPQEPVTGPWDEQRLRQVVDNLLTNAVKFSPGGGDIMVTVRREADRVVVSIEDEGVGIPAESQSSVFEPYARMRTDIPGVGLGLFICKGIIEAHGGVIEVTSLEGAGSTFTFWLPVNPTGAGTGAAD